MDYEIEVEGWAVFSKPDDLILRKLYPEGYWKPCEAYEGIKICGEYPDQVSGGDLLGLYQESSVVLYDAFRDGYGIYGKEYTPQVGDIFVLHGYDGHVPGGRNTWYKGWYIRPH